MEDITLETLVESQTAFSEKKAVPAILVAHAPRGTTTRDRFVVGQRFLVGRSKECDLTIGDGKTSKRHLLLTQVDDAFWGQDLGSTNGTFVNGSPLLGMQKLNDSDVIRVGQAVLVFHEDAAAVFTPQSTDHLSMAGIFHTGAILQGIEEAALSSRHVLITGPSGTGKELAAKALSELMGSLPLSVHNAAGFASDEEASTTIFGVKSKVFSGVEARAGLIEQAENGALFLDEIHNLSEKVQRSLLRVIEDGQTKRIGDSAVRTTNVRFIFASNAPDETKGLTHDLFARLRLVELPTLAVRVADIPSIFNEVLLRILTGFLLDPDLVFDSFGGDHYEALCLDSFEKENIRGLIDLVDRLATRIKTGMDPADAVYAVFAERFTNVFKARRQSQRVAQSDSGDISVYEDNKKLIISFYQKYNGNISAMERALREQEIICSRRLLVKYVISWGLRNKD